MIAMAHTLPYDYALVEDDVDGKLPALEWVSVAAPTLVMDGGKSPGDVAPRSWPRSSSVHSTERCRARIMESS